MTEDLQQKLKRELRGGVAYGEFHVQHFSLSTAKWITDTLMPVIQEALAEAWDDGFNEGFGRRHDDYGSDDDNPWRGEH